MKKYWRFLSLAVILVVILATIIGTSVASAQTVCSPATPISVPFAKDGLGTFCWQTTTLCNNINSWNISPKLEINGTSYANIWVLGSSIAPLNGAYTITYVSTVTPFSHFEIAGPCSGGATNTPLPGVTNTPTRTNTPGIAGDLGFGTVNGTVTSAYSGAPIAGAVVTCSHVSSSSPSRCSGTRTTGADGTYVFSNIFFHDTDQITVRVDATGFVSQTTVKSFFTTANMTANFALVAGGGATSTPTRTSTRTSTPTRTRTFTPGPSPTRTSTISLSPTHTNTVVFPTWTPSLTPGTPTATLQGGICAPVNADITSPFDFTGGGTFCWRMSAPLSGVTSNNLRLLSINGVNFTNIFAGAGQLPPQIGGYWYVTYASDFPWGHFQIFP